MILINGYPLCSPHTGMQRYMVQILKKMDQLIPKYGIEIVLVYPKDKNINLEGLNNIKYWGIDKKKKKWQLQILPSLAKKYNGIICGMANDVCAGKNSIVCLHDLMVLHKEIGMEKREIIDRIPKFLSIKYNAKRIITDSKYSKNDIIKRLHVNEKKISVIYCGWEHIKEINADLSIFEKKPLYQGEYFYTLGSILPHKNFRWIIEVAKRNQDKKFVIAGGKVEGFGGIDSSLKNVIYLGRVSDEENKALLMNCKAYLHPAKMEGFGIPPLEGLACGVPIIISNASCLPEIYENCAHYFHPDDYEIDLEKILQEPVAPPDKLLKKYSWKKAAIQWLELFKELEDSKIK